MEKTEENLSELAKIEAPLVVITIFIAIFVISGLPILANKIIGYEKMMFSLPDALINFPTVPALSPSLSQPIMLWSSIGVLIMIGVIYAVFAKLDKNAVHSFIYSDKGSLIFYSYIVIAWFLLFFGIIYTFIIGSSIASNLSVLDTLSIFISILLVDKMSHPTTISSKKKPSDQLSKVKINPKWRRDKKGRPYAICPKCHSKIYYLEAEEFIGAIFKHNIVSPNEDGELSCYQWFNEDNTPGKKDIFEDCSYLDYFECPKCLQTIAENYKEAKALFQKKVVKNQ